MKKIINAVLLLLLTLSVLSSCGEKVVPIVGDNVSSNHTAEQTRDPNRSESGSQEKEESSKHQHSTNPGIWSADLSNHWRRCEKCGEEFDLVSHTIIDSYCSICHMRLQTVDTNKTLLKIINNKEDVLLEKLYDQLSNELYELRGVYTYFDSGEKSTEAIYKNGILLYERSYNQSGSILSETKY